MSLGSSSDRCSSFRPLGGQFGLPSAQQAIRRVGVSDRQVSSHKVGVDLCPLCVEFTGEAINELLNLVLNAGVVGSCTALCDALAQKTGSQALGVVCELLCDYEGIKEFINIIEKADLDPIYMCELLTVCPVKDDGDALITRITVSPKSGPQGDRAITFDYTSKNGTGTGEMIVAVQTVDGIPVESGFLQEPKQPGSYTQNLKLTAAPDPNCDPTQEPCEQWLPGNYSVIVEICNGECGSKHPHSKVYDRKSSDFQITG